MIEIFLESGKKYLENLGRITDKTEKTVKLSRHALDLKATYANNKAMAQLADKNSAFLAEKFLNSGLEKNSLSLPVLPEMAQKILSLTQDADADVSDLSNLIHQDQALAGLVLKVANSAAYAGGESIVSLQQAIVRIGMRLLGSIALAITLQDKTFNIPLYANQSKALLRHALAAGVFSKELARMKRINVEGQFLCGMMHSMGKPAVLKLIAEWCGKQNQTLSPNELQQLIEDFHIPVGQALAESWNLPQQIRMTALYYRKPYDAPSFKKETLMTYLSSRLASWWVNPKSDSQDAIVADEAFSELNLYPDDVDALFDKMDTIRAEIKAMEL